MSDSFEEHTTEIVPVPFGAPPPLRRWGLGLLLGLLLLLLAGLVWRSCPREPPPPPTVVAPAAQPTAPPPAPLANPASVAPDPPIDGAQATQTRPTPHPSQAPPPAQPAPGSAQPAEAEPPTSAPAPQPATGMGIVAVGGAVEQTQVLNTLQGSWHLVDVCYAQALAVAPALEGTLQVALRLTPDGGVSRVELNPEGPDNQPFTVCLRQKLLTLRFPGSRSAASVSFPIMYWLKAADFPMP